MTNGISGSTSISTAAPASQAPTAPQGGNRDTRGNGPSAAVSFSPAAIAAHKQIPAWDTDNDGK